MFSATMPSSLSAGDTFTLPPILRSSSTLYFVTGGGTGGVLSPESLPLEQLVKTSAAAKSKMPAAVIGSFFKRVLPSTPPPIQMYRVRFYFVHHKPPRRRDKPLFVIIIIYFIAFNNFY